MNLHILKKFISRANYSSGIDALKSSAVNAMLVITILLLSSSAFATRRVTAVSVGGQTGSVTYGTAGSVTYNITLTIAGTVGTGSDAITFAWTGGTPTGVTSAFNAASPYNPNVTTSLVLTLTTTASTPAGNFGFKITNVDANGGGTTTSTGTLAVSKLPLTISGLTATDKIYNSSITASLSGTASLNGVLAADALNVTLGGTPTATFATANVGANKAITVAGYTISGSSSGNYTLAQPTGLTANVTVAPLTITANNATKTYGTTLSGGSGKTTFTSTGLLGGQTIGSVTIAYGTGAAATDAAGTYTGTVSASVPTGGTFTAANYSITYVVGNITVNPATLTLTASNQTKAYGAAIPTLTYTSSGYVNGDNSSIITTTPTLSTTATAASNAGTYPINISGAALANSNYTIT